MELASHDPRPRFRHDLVAEVIEADGQRFIDVIDPDTGDAFRFYEVEYSLACAMDGERDVAGLAQWAREELGIEPSPSELASVISTLGDLGYLAPDGAPAAAPDDEIVLERGVVAAAPAPIGVTAADVELGTAGARAAAPAAPAPRADDLELGLPGGIPAANASTEPVEDLELAAAGAGGPASIEPIPSLRRGPTRPDADDDGPTHLPPAATGDFEDEVSVDLSEHLSLRPSDVKEAVRASRGMQAVDVPPELLEELERKEAEAAARAAATAEATAAESAPPVDVEPEVVAERPAVWSEPVNPAAAAEEAKAEQLAAKVAARVEREPTELPDKRPVVAKSAAEADSRPVTPQPPPQAERRGTSKLLIALLVLVMLGAGAFLVWKYVLDKPAADDAGSSAPAVRDPASGKGASGTTGTTGARDPGAGAGTAAPPPAPPVATLAEAAPAATEVPGGAGGTVISAVVEGAQVETGAVLVEYQGAAPLKKKMGDASTGLRHDIEVRVPREIEAAEKKREAALAKGDAAAVKRHEAYIEQRTKRLEEKQAEYDRYQAQLDALVITAPVAGTVAAPVKKGARVAEGDVVARIEGPSRLVAVFEVTGAGGARAYAVDRSVRLTAKDDPSQVANCTVSAVEGTTVTVTCGPDEKIEPGTDVTLE